MKRSTRSPFDSFAKDAFSFLDACRVSYLVIGGLAVIAVGEPRTTADVDVIVFVEQARAAELIAHAIDAGFEASPDIERERLSTTGTLRFRKSRFQLDIIVASLPFEDEALERSSKKRMFGHAIRFPTPEDLILLKVLAGRDKDLIDAAGIMRRHAGKIDVAYVDGHLRALADLAEDLTPIRVFEELRRKVGV